MKLPTMDIRGIRMVGFRFVDKALVSRRNGASLLVNDESTHAKTIGSYRLIYGNYETKFGKWEFLFLRLLV